MHHIALSAPFAVALALGLAGCGDEPAAPAPPKIVAGPRSELVSKGVPPGGGTVAVSRPGDPLDGLAIEVPEGAYEEERTFRVSSAPIRSHALGAEFTPLSPLISVDNGGGYAKHPMRLRIPVKVPEGHFAAAFILDEATGKPEALPLVASDADSLTVLTSHFTDAVVGSISERVLEMHKEVNSKFLPGVDDWQFVNWGSYLAPKGICAGMSLGALWYFAEKRMKGQDALHGRYDNDWVNATPKIWQDDVQAYRFCSVLQTEYWENAWAKDLLRLEASVPARATFNLLKYSMIVSGEPQFVVVGGTLDDKPVRHALVAYRIADRGKIHISDPNEPGDRDRTIAFEDGKFTPYMFGKQGKGFPGVPFPQIQYIGKRSVIHFDLVRDRFRDLIDKSVGNDKFPPFRLEARNEKGEWARLVDDFVVAGRVLAVRAMFSDGIPTRLEAFAEDQSPLPLHDPQEIDLELGRRKIGIAVHHQQHGWIGFEWVTVEVRGAPTKPTGPVEKTSESQYAGKAQEYGSTDAPPREGDYSVRLIQRGDTWIIHVTPGSYYSPKEEGCTVEGSATSVSAVCKWIKSEYTTAVVTGRRTFEASVTDEQLVGKEAEFEDDRVLWRKEFRLDRTR